METPEIVPDKLKSSINYKILLAIIASAVSFQLVLTFVLVPDDGDFIISVVSFINPLATGIMGLFVAYRYKGSAVFGRSYLFLGFGFISLFFGEIVYMIYDLMLDLEPYPSIADIFFFAYLPFFIAHLVLNIRFFQPSTKLVTKLWVSAIPIVIITSYVLFSLSEIGETNFDFYYGILFVSATSIALALTVFGAAVFKEGVLGKAWLILLFGILALTFADDWYYYLELLGEFDLYHPVNIFWYAGYWIVFYALLKHKQVI